MKRRAALELIGATLAAGLAPNTRAAPDFDLTRSELSINLNGRTRTAYVWFGAARRVSLALPLVIGFHGGTGNAEGYIGNSRLFAKGEQAGFILACPQGTTLALPGNYRVWNSGPEYEASSSGAEDVLFTRQLIRTVGSIHPVDAKRVYATGFSNGGQMAYRLGLELAGEIAAIAPMSGGRLANGERPSRPVPVRHFHGTADSVYPFAGGLGAHSLGRVPHAPIPAVIGEWIRFDEASPAPQLQPHDGWELRRHEGRAPVDLVLISGMGHQIAGVGDNGLRAQILKPEPDAVRMALEFFADHPLT